MLGFIMLKLVYSSFEIRFSFISAVLPMFFNAVNADSDLNIFQFETQ